MPRAKAAPTYEDLVARMRDLHTRLIRARRTVASAESCTGGLLGTVLTAHGGASTFYRGGVVAYADDAKTLFADVPAHLIHAHGAVSGVVAQALAAGARRRLGADIGLGVTGIAGPGGATPGKPVGLVYVAIDSDAHSRTKKAQFGHEREGNRRASVALALDLLEETLGRSRGRRNAGPQR